MEFEPRDRAAYLPAADALVCADLHVGRDETSAVAFRVGEHEDLRERFATLCERYEPREVVVAGDLLHAFSGLPTGVVETVEALESAAVAVDARFVVTPGNHDTMVAELCDGPTPAEYRLDAGDGHAADVSIVVTHGHVRPETDADWYVVGHDHPTLEVEGRRRPCYLHGRGAGDAGVLMLPAFSRLPAGVAVNTMTAADFRSPLVEAADALRPIVRDEAADRTHEFPPLGECRRLL
jgi:putative SbcD/Mre11-related phosphoesterase